METTSFTIRTIWKTTEGNYMAELASKNIIGLPVQAGDIQAKTCSDSQSVPVNADESEIPFCLLVLTDFAYPKAQFMEISIR